MWSGWSEGRRQLVHQIFSNCTHPHRTILVEHATPVLWELRCHDNSMLSRVGKYSQDGVV